MPEDRRQLHGWVSEESMDGWTLFARAQDTNVSALLEVIGLALAKADGSTEDLDPTLRGWVEESRRVVGRRSRRS